MTTAPTFANEALQIATQIAIDSAAHRAELTERESCVLNMLVSGYAAGEIGETLSISPKTVKRHCHAIYRKMKCRTRYEVVGRILERRG